MKKILFTILALNSLTLSAFCMSFDEAKNLVSKTGIGVSIKDIENIKDLEINNAINKIISNSNSELEVKPPNWVNDINIQEKKEFTEEQRKEYREKLNQQAKELKMWWYKEMIKTDSPLTEHLTLFWHNHFTSGYKKVRSPKLMFNQNQIFRKNALGNFKTLLHEISKDPAMIIYLDNQQNRKEKPNENFAREVLELFTIGEGNYKEKDIKESARAFTGWKVNNKTGEFFFNKKTYDDKNKTFFGKTGKFNGDDILNIILEQPKTSEFITKKFWKEFISDTPNKDEVKRIANIFKNSNYEIKVLMKEILTSPFFNKKENYGNMIKSPVELIAGTFRLLNIPFEENDKNIEQIIKYSEKLGQDIFDPPNVKGWEGGTAWINSDSLTTRQQLLKRLTSGMEIFSREYQEKHTDFLPNKNIYSLWVDDNKNNYESIKNYIYPFNPINKIDDNLNKTMFVRKAILDPVYKLK